jgi:L-threonylcarbamoyladenylate synthase
LEEAVAVLRAGDVVAVPAETVYGLAADALNPAAVARIFEAKERPFFDPLICHVSDWEQFERFTRMSGQVKALARALGDRFWPGPLTLVVPRENSVPDLVCAGLETVAVRMPAHPVFSALLRRFGGPLAAPSANRFGRISPTAAEHVWEELSGRIPLILDAGDAPFGLESTIVKVGERGVRVLRSGPVTVEELKRVVPVEEDDSSAVESNRPEAPGRLLSHYAPRTSLRLASPATIGAAERGRLGLLAWRDCEPGFGGAEVLSAAGDLREAASRLFGALRRLDAGGYAQIVAELVPEQGLGVAINDRLRRAAAPR